jgi:hypothetical protein
MALLSNLYFACRDKGMGLPGNSREDIASHRWQYFLEDPDQWPGAMGAMHDKQLFFGWVKKSVEKYDKEMGNCW